MCIQHSIQSSDAHTVPEHSRAAQQAKSHTATEWAALGSRTGAAQQVAVYCAQQACRPQCHHGILYPEICARRAANSPSQLSHAASQRSRSASANHLCCPPVEPAARAGHCSVLRASNVVPTAARTCLLAMFVVAGACMCRLFSMHTLLQSTSTAAASLPLERLHHAAALKLCIAAISWIPASAEHDD